MPVNRLQRLCRSWMLHGAAFACLFVGQLLQGANAPGAAIHEPLIITSASKQFVVRGKSQTSAFAGRKSDVVYADPSLTAMVCERVREALEDEMAWGRRWRDPVFISIFPASGRGETPRIQAIPGGASGWRYRIEMPDELSRRDFLQPIIHVLLLEFANRGAVEESTHLPPWLIEGMTEHLLAGPLTALALQPNTMVVRNKYSDDAGPMLRDKVREQGVLTVDQLTWPDVKEGDSKGLEAYRSSAHLFVRELLRLPGGKDAMTATLALLPKQLNWQTAFLLGYEAHFKRILDAEKWWSLVVVQAKMHERNIFWPAAESQARLEEILYTPMQVRLTPNELPHIAPVALATLLHEWSWQDQEPILRGKVQQLLGYRLHVTPDFGTLANEYRTVLEGYIAARSSRKLADKEATSRPVRSLVNRTVEELAGLDERRSSVVARLLAAPPRAEEVTLTRQ